ncbi:MAG: metal-dependent hydrolase [Bacteroidota bacterium]
MKITYYGHFCFGMEVSGKNLLFDPFITPNKLAHNIEVEDIKADYVLLSHGHQDHVADAEKILHQSDATLISNYEIVSYYAEKGFEKGHPMNHGGQAKFDFGWVKFVNAVHSSVLPDGTYGGNPGGFIIRTEDVNVYFAGDTALTYDMKLIGEYEDIDLAIFPIGDNFTMGPKDAIIASDFVNCSKVVGAHYDTFPYIEIDKEGAKTSFSKARKELILMDIGESIEL